MLLVLEFFNMWRLVLIIYATYPAILLNICELVDRECVLFVEWCTVQLLCCRYRLFRCAIFNKGEPIIR